MKTLNIYLADDDTDDREFFIEALEEISIPTKITQFDNGHDLMLELFSKTKLPDAIFLDLRMPIMDGFECLADIRSFPKFTDIKVIVYSTSYHEREVKQLKADGANQYLQKPISFSELVRLLSRSIKAIAYDGDDRFISSQFILKSMAL